MIERQFTLTNELGLHARIAGQLVRQIRSFDCVISLVKGDQTYNAKSLIDLIRACIRQHEPILLTFDGPDELLAAAETERIFAEELNY